jgi:hypothetical protein
MIRQRNLNDIDGKRKARVMKYTVKKKEQKLYASESEQVGAMPQHREK